MSRPAAIAPTSAADAPGRTPEALELAISHHHSSVLLTMATATMLNLDSTVDSLEE